jgi:alanine racemase
MRAGALAHALVDLAAVGHNAALFVEKSRTPVLAVVKADAFGHGMPEVARAALAHGASWLGVTSAAEALAVRAAGIDAPVLSWLHGPSTDFAALISSDVDLSVASVEQLAAVATGAQRAGRAALAHLKVDTGLSRSGAGRKDWPELVRWARRFERDGLLRVQGVWSHLAAAETSGSTTTQRQVAVFREALAVITAAGLTPAVRHLANSAAALTVPETHFDLVRAGIGLYGVEPIPGRRFGLRPAMTVRSSLVLVKQATAGTGVSYHHDHVTSRPTTLALLPVGFADGLPRAAQGRATVLVHTSVGAFRRPIVGRIAMDQCVVDAGDLPVRAGDQVTLFGPGRDGEPTVAEWASWAGTNPHEILTGIGPRVPRHPHL